MLSIKATITGSPRAVAAQFKRDLRAELLTIGRQWHSRVLTRHFETSAGQRYGYQKRAKRYQIQKARKYGHQKPLVFSGQLERMVRGVARVTSTTGGVRVALRGPRYLYAFRKNLKEPDKAAELTATLPAEENALAKSLDWGMTQRMNANTTKEPLTGA